jgi:hypothetical protein
LRSEEPVDYCDWGVTGQLGRGGLVGKDPDRPGADLAMHGDHPDTAGQLVARGQVPGVDEFGSLAHAE